MAKFNLDTIVGKCVHRPIASMDDDKLPLYKRNDGVFDKVYGQEKTRSDAWMRAVEHTYSSPNNIKRIFITYKGVYVELYRPIHGDKSNETLKFYSYESVNPDFKPIEIFNDRSKIPYVTRSGLGMLKSQWSCSNLEEVYFDWTLLLSYDILNLGLGNMLDGMTKDGTVGNMNPNVVKMLVDTYCINSGENISKAFPRLRAVGYISKLQLVMDNYKRKPGEDSVEDLLRPLYVENVIKQAENSPNVYVSIYKIPNVSKYNQKYSTRSYYSFDVEVLEPYFNKLSDKIAKAWLEKSNNKEKFVKNEFEKLLESIEKSNGLTSAQQMAVVLLKSDPNNTNKYISEMSEEGRNKYIRKEGW